jgi:hypothetical protein
MLDEIDTDWPSLKRISRATTSITRAADNRRQPSGFWWKRCATGTD